MGGLVLLRRWRARRHTALLATLAVFGFWAATTLAVTPSFQRLWGRAADRLFGAPHCDGLAPTIVGTPGDDILSGTTGVDVIVGLGGDDQIYGHGGSDRICGHDGDDLLVGGDGADRLIGHSGDDTLRGGDGLDLLRGGRGDDTLEGGAGDDELFGSEGSDHMDGGDHTLRDGCYGGGQSGDDTAANCEVLGGNL
jgi:Ca2+-binding RTX toxin-like protein